MISHGGCTGFPSTREALGFERGAAGYALLVIMILATVLLISLTAALPSIYTAGQREREEELIFRGTEYARAIALFRRQFGRFPVSVDELLETNGIRFLRRRYPDPMSRGGQWRFIHADANGILLDSRVMGSPAGRTGEQRQAAAASGSETPHASAFLGQGRGTRGAFIAGVASSSGRKSIRVRDGRTRYDEWEFLGVSPEFAAGGQTPSRQSPLSPSPGQRMLPPLTEGPIPQQ